MDDIAIIRKSDGKVVATHRSEQNITIKDHYPPESYGECEIVMLPKGLQVDYEKMEDPRKTPEQVRESAILTRAREKELAAKDFKSIAEQELIDEGKITSKVESNK
jgi:hypothetical protein